ncbi:MAG: hypothetical protein KJ072_24700 [Verrucomicrobia bacterium]|nr:hypothetical protein [Verrucomicrobiota bacterium]
MMIRILAVGLAMTLPAAAAVAPRVVPLAFPVGEGGQGSVMAADLEGNGEHGLVVTAPGLIAAYGAAGERKWLCETPIRVSAGSSESRGLPGHDAPGVQVADIDGDGRPELLHLDESSRVHIRNARTGELIRAVPLTPPEGAERWEHLAVANLRGQGDRDLVLQATNAKGYRVGRYVAAFAIEDLAGKPLWATDHFGALAHGPFRLADLDGDGRDEVCGFTILKPDGSRTDWVYPPIEKQYAGGASFHIDSLFVADVRGDVPGLEVVLLEEGRNYVGIVSLNQGLLSWTTHGRQEPQNAVVGEFDPARPGLEIWCRSRYDRHQKPWVLDSRGEVISSYALDDVAPEGWTDKGLEELSAIHWTGAAVQLAAAKERHRSGDVCLFEPMTGRFVGRFKEVADRVYVADVSGDWREEIVVVNGKALHIYENPEPNPRPDRPRLWQEQHYRRSKQGWNYYSP